MELSDYRQQLNGIDDEILHLFEERMHVAEKIGEYKREHNLPVLDNSREQEILQRVSGKMPEELQSDTVVLYSTLMQLSRNRQSIMLGIEGEETKAIQQALNNTPRIFPREATVACQGVQGAYSMTAAERLFRMPRISFYPSFESVFQAIENGECKYGIIPIENSTAGSVNAVYTQMLKHRFYIVRSVRVKVDHSLVAKPGTRMEDIKEIFSHEQAINQSAEFLEKLKGVSITSCANTAQAAKIVAESERTDVAALSSRNCLKLYGLECLAEAVQDNGDNYTTFICITKELEIYPGAEKTSIMLVLPHTMGSLYKTLSRFYALDINLVKIESRRVPKRNFEYMFYFDIEASVYSPELMQLINELSANCEQFRYLGSYSEVL